MKNYFRHFVLMSALDSVLSAGAAAVAAVEHEAKVLFDEIKSAFGLRHAVTGQVNEFDDQDAAYNFLSNVDDAHHWQTADGSAPAAPKTGDGEASVGTASFTPGATATNVEVDLGQLRADVAAASAADQNQAATDAPAAAQDTEQPAADTPAA